MDHLDVVPGRTGSQIGNTGFATNSGGNRLEDRAHPFVGWLRTASHYAGTVECAMGATRKPHAKKSDTLFSQLFPTPVRIFEIGVATINDNVAGIKMKYQIFDHLIH
jgi:hypothetical protein